MPAHKKKANATTCKLSFKELDKILSTFKRAEFFSFVQNTYLKDGEINKKFSNEKGQKVTLLGYVAHKGNEQALKILLKNFHADPKVLTARADGQAGDWSILAEILYNSSSINKKTISNMVDLLKQCGSDMENSYCDRDLATIAAIRDTIETALLHGVSAKTSDKAHPRLDEALKKIGKGVEAGTIKRDCLHRDTLDELIKHYNVSDVAEEQAEPEPEAPTEEEQAQETSPPALVAIVPHTEPEVDETQNQALAAEPDSLSTEKEPQAAEAAKVQVEEEQAPTPASLAADDVAEALLGGDYEDVDYGDVAGLGEGVEGIICNWCFVAKA
jgi:hypothetical protein